MTRSSLTFLAAIVITCAASLIFHLAGVPAFAQRADAKYKIGDRVEADIDQDRTWQNATVDKVFEALSGIDNTHKDSVVVALADTVAAQGSDSTIESRVLAELNIPYGKPEPLKIKMISRTARLKSGNDRQRAIYLIITDKRYLIYTIEVNQFTSQNAVSEFGAVVGERSINKTVSGDLITVGSEGAARRAMMNRFYWANLLIAEKIAAGGTWQGRTNGYLVKTDDGKTYLLGAEQLRPLTRE